MHRARIWAAIREAKTFTNEQLVEDLQISYKIVQQYVYKLLQLGYLEIVDKHSGWHGSTTCRLVRDTGPIAPNAYRRKKDGQIVEDQARSSRLRIWDALKILQGGAVFTLERVIECSGVNEGIVSPYILLLRRGSYIRRISPGRNSKSLFKLVNYTGPVPPIPCDEGLYDANTKKFVKYYKGSLRGKLDSEEEISIVEEQTEHCSQHEITDAANSDLTNAHPDQEFPTFDKEVNEVASMNSQADEESHFCSYKNYQEAALPGANNELLISSETDDVHQDYFTDNTVSTSVSILEIRRHQSSLNYQVVALNESLAITKKLADLLKVLHRSLTHINEMRKNSDLQKFTTNSSDTTSNACSSISKNSFLTGDIVLIEHLYCLTTDLSEKLINAIDKTTKFKDEN